MKDCKKCILATKTGYCTAGNVYTSSVMKGSVTWYTKCSVKNARGICRDFQKIGFKDYIMSFVSTFWPLILVVAYFAFYIMDWQTVNISKPTPTQEIAPAVSVQDIQMEAERIKAKMAARDTTGQGALYQMFEDELGIKYIPPK